MGALCGFARKTGYERGFTLVEVMVTILVMGILFAIATASWQNLIEGRRVASAANQVKADLRLAHSSATNRLASAYIVFRRDGSPVSCNGQQADYCLVQPVEASMSNAPRRFTDNDFSTTPARRGVNISSPNISLDPTGVSIPGVIGGTTSTVEFRADGSAATLGTTVGSPTITVRGTSDTATASQSCAAARAAGNKKPCHDVTFNTATSRVRVD